MASFSQRLGANPVAKGRTEFRVWAPDRRQVDVLVDGAVFPLDKAPGGYWSGVHPLEAGTRYRFRLDDTAVFPDPCSRFQPEGPHGPSEIVDPTTFQWTDQAWRGVRLKGQVLYELHVGTFTPQGTYAGLIERLPHLKEVGVTVLELMPVNTFPGRFNWGYDGVDLFAPCAVYGRPDDLRRLVNEAHRIGLAVILDVVYNHLGPDGNYLRQFAKSYFTDRYPNEWGEALNFDGPDARPVRDFFIENACYWVSEFHLDGLRVDATQCMHDSSERHIVGEIVEAVRRTASGRDVLIIAENEPQDVRYVTTPEQGGHGADAIWVDDFHHSARVALTGTTEAYLTDYRGTAQELLTCARHNALYQGTYYRWQKKRRGGYVLHAPAEQMVFFLENHDQVANSFDGRRPHEVAGLRRARALTAYFLLLPQTPLLFMGQEYFAPTRFLYFTDHPPELQEKVVSGRRDFLSQFQSAAHVFSMEGSVLNIGDEAFRQSRLDPEGPRKRPEALLFHRELLRLRREDPTFAAQDKTCLDGIALGEQAVALRYFGQGDEDRLVLMNLGPQVDLAPSPVPLVVPPPGRRWEPVLSSEEVRFGGQGALYPPREDAWFLPGQCTVVLRSVRDT